MKIDAYHDIWLIGDDFLHEMFPVLITSRTEALSQKKDTPYIFEYYNVDGFFTNPMSMTRGIMARMLHALAEGLNSRTKLPKFVILLPDIDFPRSTLQHNFSMNLVFEDCLIYFVKKIERFFALRREDLKNKQLGAVPFETRFIWVKMIDRPPILNHPDENRSRYLVSRGKLNKCLDDIVSSCSGHHIMSIQLLKYDEHFDTY